jgi:hypothetical protein
MAIMEGNGKSSKKKALVDRASTSSTEKRGNVNTIEMMRKERLQREQAERKREDILLNPELANQVSERDSRHANEGKYYNSGYSKR